MVGGGSIKIGMTVQAFVPLDYIIQMQKEDFLCANFGFFVS